MKAEKVIDILERIVEEDWHVYTDDAIEALQIAAERMEKEIPKIPLKIENELVINGHKVGSTYEYRCPNGMCNEFVRPGMTYCPWCGQKLDWEEKND